MDQTGRIKEPPFPLPEAEARRFIARQSHWYQKIYLGNGIWTLPDPEILHETVWSCFEKALPPSLAGLSVLDVGTNAGYFALQAKLRGAHHVVGTEIIDMYLEQAETIRKIWGVEIDYRKLEARQLLTLNQRFNLVVFAGLLYHLKNPLQAIEDLGAMCTDAILLETEFIPDDPANNIVVRQGSPPQPRPVSKGFMKFIETNELSGDDSNWWVPDTECVLGMLRTAGFRHIAPPVVLYGFRLCIAASKKPDSLLRLDQFGR